MGFLEFNSVCMKEVLGFEIAECDLLSGMQRVIEVKSRKALHEMMLFLNRHLNNAPHHHAGRE